MDVPKGRIISRKKKVLMSEVSSIRSIPLDTTIVFKNMDDVEKFITLYEKEGGRTRSEVIEYLSHFMFASDTFEGEALHFASNILNHRDDHNVHIYHENGEFVMKALTNIKAGEELLRNYHTFCYSEAYTTFCKKEGKKDCFTIAKDLAA